jgi:hypothetical protein
MEKSKTPTFQHFHYLPLVEEWNEVDKFIPVLFEGTLLSRSFLGIG